MSKKLKLVGRLTHEHYMHNNELVTKSKFKLLKRHSVGALQDLIQDPEYDIKRIDFSKHESGVYELEVTNISIDIETGYADDWELKLTKIDI